MARMLNGANRITLHSEEKSSVLTYLRSAPVVVVAAGMALDERDPSRGHVVPIGLATDGEFIWPLRFEYDLAHHDDDLDSALVESIRRRQYVVPQVADQDMQAIRRQATATRDDPALADDLGGDGTNPFA